MKIRNTIGATLLLGGLAVAVSGQMYWLVTSAHAGEQQTLDHEHDQSKQPEHVHPEGEHDHGELVVEKPATGDSDEHEHDQETQDHEAHDVQDDHTGDGHDDESAIHLSQEVMREFGIKVRIAGGGSIARTLRLPGEVVYNADRIAHVSPMVAGSVQQVNVSAGDHVEAGQVIALLTSRELAAARSDYLAAVARLELASENLARDRQLLSGNVGTKRAVDVSRKAYREANIEHNQALNALYALGFAREQVEQIAQLDDTAFSTYEMLSPLSGIVTQRHITIGEIIEPDRVDAPFVVADLSTVWINLTVYQRDLPFVRAGQPVTIEFGDGISSAQGTVAFLSPALDDTTRTATARLVLDNPDGVYRPGLFVSGHVEVDRETAPVVVPNTALTEMDGKTVVFVQTEKGFEPREVRRGRMTPEATEIIDGLAVGERYASHNVLALKAETNRAALEHAGHVH